ncbi:polymorphic toxin-type HINT domain-containing protein [Niveispirillum sp. KHB5.9]|uniref:polymorphic toxin-type HINT domain-containing protein n=1 Tax=Niveispirillum sp. KHB5.9 TaxID=3400269 RepID=UPI003A8A480C
MHKLKIERPTKSNWCIIILLAVILSLHLIVTPPPSRGTGVGERDTPEVAGAVSGSFAVAGSGAATYAVALAVPPGIAGVEPSLSLVYSSHEGNGLMGVGWTLTGLSAITRCPRIQATDKVAGGIGFDGNDRYCLDGERLILISGKEGAPGATYRTERESWIRITVGPGCDGVPSQSPCRFFADTKEGARVEFGTEADARIAATQSGSGASRTIRIWAINKITDRNGNYVRIRYASDGSFGYQPTEIEYTGNQNAPQPAAMRRIRFNYEGRKDEAEGFTLGYPTRTRVRLHEIQTFVGDDPVMKYRFEYDYSKTTGHSLLLRLRQCDANGICLPATEFAWQANEMENWRKDTPIGRQQEALNTGEADDGIWLTADFTGTGLPGLVHVRNAGASSKSQGHAVISTFVSDGKGAWQKLKSGAKLGDSAFYKGNRWIAMDVDGDSRVDLVEILPGAKPSTQTYRSKGDGEWVADLPTGGYKGKFDNGEWLPVDIDGDGRADLVCIVADVKGEKTTVDLSILKWNEGPGTVVGQKVMIRAFQSHSTATRHYDGKTGDWMVIDVNGDGRSDLLNLYTKDSKVQILTQPAPGPGEGWAEPRIDRHTVASDGKWIQADLNGDGLMDLIQFSKSKTPKSISAYALTALGNGSWVSRKLEDFTVPGAEFKEIRQWIVTDQNLDGLADLIVQTDNAAYGYMFTRTDGLEPKGLAPLPVSGKSKLHSLQSLDADGDSIPDLVSLAMEGGTMRVGSRLTPGPVPDLVSAVTTGLGGRTEIVYKSLTDPSVYVKGSDARYPETDIQVARQVVAEEKVFAGSGTDAQSGHFSYSYTGLRISNDGRGSQGFGTRTRTDINAKVDPQLRTRAVTAFHQQWPLTGYIDKETVYGPDGNGGLTIPVDEQRETYQHLKRNGLSEPYYIVQKIESARDHFAPYGRPARQWKEGESAAKIRHESGYTYTRRTTFHFDAPLDRLLHVTNVSNLEDGAPIDPLYTCYAYRRGPAEPSARTWQDYLVVATKTTTRQEDCAGDWNAGETAAWTRDSLNWTRFDHDPQTGNVVAVRTWNDQSGTFVTSGYEYDVYGNTRKLIEPKGNVTELDYAYGKVTRLRTRMHLDAGAVLEQTAEFDPRFGLLTRQTDENGTIIFKLPDPTAAEPGYDGFGRVLRVQSPTGNQTDPRNPDLVTVIEKQYARVLDTDRKPAGLTIETWRRESWSDGDRKSWAWSKTVVDGMGRDTRHQAGRQAGTVKTVDIDYTPHGLVRSVSLPYFTQREWTTSYSYNIQGLIRTRTDPEGVEYRQAYADALSMQATGPDPANEIATGERGTRTSVTTYTRFDLKKRMAWMAYPDFDGKTDTATIENNPNRANATYDPLGREIRNIDQLGVWTEFKYDSLNRLISVKGMESGETRITYDDNDQVIATFDAAGNRTGYEYDGLGRLLSETTAASRTSYGYDAADASRNAKGRLDSVSVTQAGGKEPVIRYAYSYDLLGRVVKVETMIPALAQEPFVTRYVYDVPGRVTSVTAPEQAGAAETRYSYDPGQGTLLTAAYRRGSAVSLTKSFSNHTALGDARRIDYSNGVGIDLTYSPLGRPLTSRTTKGSVVLRDFGYNWNDAGMLLWLNDRRKEAENGVSLGRAFTYDALGNTLTALSPQSQKLRRYGYDYGGNLTRQDDLHYSYRSDKPDQLSHVCDRTTNPGCVPDKSMRFGYDAQGRLESRQASPSLKAGNLNEDWRYGFNAADDLVEVESGGTVQKAAYDHTGRRVMRQDMGRTGGRAYPAGTTYYISPLTELHFTDRNDEKTWTYTNYAFDGDGAFFADSVSKADAVPPLIRGSIEPMIPGGLPGLALFGTLALAVGVMARTGLPDLAGMRHRLRRPPDGFGLFRRCIATIVAASFLIVQLAPGHAQAAKLTGPGIPKAGRQLVLHGDPAGNIVLTTDLSGREVNRIVYDPIGGIERDDSTGENNFRPKMHGVERDENTGLDDVGDNYYHAGLGMALLPTGPAPGFMGRVPPGLAGFAAGIGDGGPAGKNFGPGGGHRDGPGDPDDPDHPELDHPDAPDHSDAPGGGDDWMPPGAPPPVLAPVEVGMLLIRTRMVARTAGKAAMLAELDSNPLTLPIGIVLTTWSIINWFKPKHHYKHAFLVGHGANHIAASFLSGGGEASIHGMLRSGRSPLHVPFEDYQASPAMSGISAVSVAVCPTGTGLNSFPAGTQVVTAEGDKPIEQVAVGDQVLSLDETTGQQEVKNVTELTNRVADRLVTVQYGNATIEATPEHPFYVPGRGWITAEALRVGDPLLGRDGRTAPVSATATRDNPVKVFNFEVADNHNYYAGKQAILVHNPRNNRQDCVGGTPRPGSPTWRRTLQFYKDEGMWKEENGIQYVMVEQKDGSYDWAPLKSVNMGHIVAAVDFWNNGLRKTGKRSWQVRNVMLDDQNYMFELASVNKSNGAKMKKTYLPEDVTKKINKAKQKKKKKK